MIGHTLECAMALAALVTNCRRAGCSAACKESPKAKLECLADELHDVADELEGIAERMD